MTGLLSFDVGCAATDGVLAISGTSLHAPSWICLDVSELWMSAEQRGTDLVIPGRPGAIPMPRRATVTPRSIRLLIGGTHRYNGTRYNNVRAGLFANVQALNALVVQPTYVGNGTRSIQLSAPGGGGLTGVGHVVGLDLGEHLGGQVMRAVLRISLPDGELTPY